MKKLILSWLRPFMLIISSVGAVDYKPLDIEDGQWQIVMDFNNFLTTKQKKQMEDALKRLEEMKKKNPAMAAQMEGVTKSLGLEGNTIKREACFEKSAMKEEMDKMMSGQVSSDKKCVGKILKSTDKMIEGQSKCGDKIHYYKITVQNKKKMTTEITSADGKKIIGRMSFVSSNCKK